MNVLISNDDGVFAPGLKALAELLADEHQTLVVAPDRNRSGASNSLTLDRPLEANRHANGFLGINGTENRRGLRHSGGINLTGAFLGAATPAAQFGNFAQMRLIAHHAR